MMWNGAGDSRVVVVTGASAGLGRAIAERELGPIDVWVDNAMVSVYSVQVGSALAYRSIPLQSAYCAARHAILGFTASLRSELMHDGSNVRVTMVHMPALDTPRFDWAEEQRA